MPLSGNFHPEWGCLAPAPNFMRTARVVAVATAIGATSGAAVVLSLVERPAASPATDAGETLVVVHSLVQPADERAPTAPSPAVAATAAPVAKPVSVAKPTTVAVPRTVAAPRIVATPAAAPAATPSQMPISAQASAQSSGRHMPPPATQAAPVASDASTTATPQAPASVAAIAEVPPAGEAALAPVSDQPIIATEQPEPRKSFARKRHTADYDTPRGEQTPSARKRAISKKQGLAPFLRHLFSSARNVISYNPN